MNIIIVQQDPDGTSDEEQTFSQNVITFGRNAGDCDVAFDNLRFPMVSRRHAELRWENGVWKLADLDSSYGTFINEERIHGQRAISFGDVMRFGKDGPRYRVVWFEVSADPNSVSRPVPHPMAAANPAMPQPTSTPSLPLDPQFYGETQAKDVSAELSAPAYLDFTDGRSSYKFSKTSVWLGRGLDCDIIFDASSATVSRRHAEIVVADGKYLIVDNNSFNGTLVNEQRVSATTELFHHDQIRLGMGGPVIRFNAPHRPAPLGSSMPGQRAVAAEHAAQKATGDGGPGSKTMVFKLDPSVGRSASQAADADAEPQLLMSLDLGTAATLTIGRDSGNDIKLDGLQISKRHARLSQNGDGVFVQDLGSTNGIYIDGERVSRGELKPENSLQIGTFLIRSDGAGIVKVYDARSKMRIDAADIVSEARSTRSRGKVRLLDGVSLSVEPNEFVGVLGPSGAGKSTLLDLLSGKRKPTSGAVSINGTNLYRHLDSLKLSIGYVPQEDIIHRELSVYRTLYYVAKLRLSRDVSSAELRRIVDEVLDVTGLSDHRSSPVSKLSGGQRKRVSIAVELVTKPSVIFLDEPTSGLDPATEEKIMLLFRQMAEAGRTVIMTTHAMENVRLFDKIIVLMSGKLVFYGTPDDALQYFDAANFKQLYEKLEEPTESDANEGRRVELSEKRAEELKQRFAGSPQYKSLIRERIAEAGSSAKRGKKKRLGIFGSIRQFITLSRRYFEVLLKDKLTLFILFAQAPVIALMTFFVTAKDQPRDFVYFVVALVAVWFGTSVSAREIVRERPVYIRERMYNLGILPYVASKFTILGVIVLVQCLLLWVPLKVLDAAGSMSMPGEFFGVPQLWTMLLTAGVGISTGLLVSALVRTQSMAASLVPLILIPQLLFSGLAGVPHGVSKAASLLMPAAWSFDTMKRFSTLDTLEPEGANPNGETKGLGLYKFIESENETMVNDAKKQVDEIRRSAEAAAEDPTLAGPLISDIPDIETMKKMPEDLSPYITFLHPWMHEVLNQIVLMLMFGIMAVVTLIVMRLKDIR